MKKTLIAALIALGLLMPFIVSGCNSHNPAPEGFAIYLTRNDIPVAKMAMQSHFDLADEPIVSLNDIISYDQNTHEIELTPDVYERVMKLTVPTSGKSFVVCVDKKPIYWGAFWTPVSSQSFDGVTIWVNLSAETGNTIRLEPGYPSESFFKGEDPRSNAEIIKSLEAAGKLK